MYILKKEGLGKKWCGDEIIFLTKNLSQRKLKKLFNAKCEFVTYEQQKPSEETETSSSTAKENKSNGSSRRKANKGKVNKEPKAD